MTTISIRPATGQDVDALAELSRQLGYPIETSQLRHNLELLNADKDQAILVAVDAGGHVVGWMGLARRIFLETPARADITALVVDNAHRGHGIGTQLIAAAQSWAKAHNLHLLALKSNAKREAAHQFYRAQGFSQLKTQLAFYKTLE